MLHDLYAYGLYTGHQMATTIILSNEPTHQQVHQAQTQTGLHQLFYGWQAIQWHTACNLMHPMINSTQYFAKCMTIIWKAVLQIWTIHNNHFAPHWPITSRQNTTTKHHFPNLSWYPTRPKPQGLINIHNPGTIMMKPTWTIQQWVDNCHNHIQNQAKAVMIRAKLYTHDIHQYFTRSLGPNHKQQPKTYFRPP